MLSYFLFTFHLDFFIMKYFLYYYQKYLIYCLRRMKHSNANLTLKDNNFKNNFNWDALHADCYLIATFFTYGIYLTYSHKMIWIKTLKEKCNKSVILLLLDIKYSKHQQSHCKINRMQAIKNGVTSSSLWIPFHFVLNCTLIIKHLFSQ